jgi:hypothetical protein
LKRRLKEAFSRFSYAAKFIKDCDPHHREPDNCDNPFGHEAEFLTELTNTGIDPRRIFISPSPSLKPKITNGSHRMGDYMQREILETLSFLELSN